MTALRVAAESFEVANLLDDLKNTFFFKTSHKYATYLYAIVAGPYDYKEFNAEGCPPMRIYARRTVLPDVT